MSERVVTIAVTPEERRIISALRDLPASPLRDLLGQVMVDLVEFVREPSCPEMQADGVPCASPNADCEECRMLREVLETLRDRLSRT
jgi:hypothetical protein